MSNEELHALVLEHLLGCEIVEIACGPNDYFVDGTKIRRWQIDDEVKYSHFIFPDGDSRWEKEKFYDKLFSENLGQAWELIEIENGSGRAWAVFAGHSYENSVYLVTNFNLDGVPLLGWTLEDEQVSSSSTSVPRAICIAILLSRGVELPNEL